MPVYQSYFQQGLALQSSLDDGGEGISLQSGTTYESTVNVGLAHELRSPYPCGKLLPGSLASESLAAEIMYQKVVQCVPSYRMEADFTRSGIMLSRQTMTNWINRFSLEGEGTECAEEGEREAKG